MNFQQSDLAGRPCPLCGSTNLRDDPTGALLLGCQPPVRLQQCRDCGMRLLNPSPRPTALVQQYGEVEFYSAEMQAARTERNRRYLGRKCERLRRQSPNGSTLFEFGCGTGEFLLTASAAGWESIGVDANPRAVARAQERGAAATVASSPEEIAAFGQFDVVASFHTLEHIFDLASTLPALAAMVKPGGLLYLEVPHQIDAIMDRLKVALRAQPRHLDPFHHVNFFTPAALRTWARKQGLEVAQLTTHIPFSEHIYFAESPPRFGRPLAEVVQMIGMALGRGPLIEATLRLSATERRATGVAAS
jgi:2-polyprenyl-3-methyl-5-hydroxy-6-metoxy-1,4-benzoquinol methylase